MDYYSMMNSINIDDNTLMSLGFNSNEVLEFKRVYNSGIRFTPNMLQQCGYSFEQAKRLIYMYNICIGKVQIGSKEEQIKHLRKMFGSNYRISIQDLAVSKVTDVPRVAVVGGIIDQPYCIWNSNQYKGKDKLYKVIDVSGQKITIETPRKPKLAYGQTKNIPGVLEIKGVTNNGNAIVMFDKKYCKLCNRFIIIASLRNPEFHFGKYEILCFEGTKVYVYATSIGTKEVVKYKMGNQRVYAYGIYPNDIPGKLEIVAKNVYQHLCGVRAERFDANSNYSALDKIENTYENTEVEL